MAGSFHGDHQRPTVASMGRQHLNKAARTLDAYPKIPPMGDVVSREVKDAGREAFTGEAHHSCQKRSSDYCPFISNNDSTTRLESITTDQPYTLTPRLNNHDSTY